MIKTKTEKGSLELMACGTVEELLADTSIIILGIYNRLDEQNEEMADVFKNSLKDLVGNDIVFAKSDEEVEKAMNKGIDKRLDELIKEIDEQIDKAKKAEKDGKSDEVKEDINGVLDGFIEDMKKMNKKLDVIEKRAREIGEDK